MPQLFKEMPTQKKLSTEISFPLLKVDKRDKILIIGDFNARVGGDHEIWKESSEHMAKESVMIKWEAVAIARVLCWNGTYHHQHPIPIGRSFI